MKQTKLSPFITQVIKITIIKVFIKCKILSVETILSAYTHTHTHTYTHLHTQAPAHMSILTIQSLIHTI